MVYYGIVEHDIVQYNLAQNRIYSRVQYSAIIVLAVQWV